MALLMAFFVMLLASANQDKQKLADAGAGHFASGWVWLAEKGGKLTLADMYLPDWIAAALPRTACELC